jgi:drug/metabolite transporter (DMT)-like permease
VRWVWLAVTVVTSTVGDLVSAKGMVAHGEIEHFGARRITRLLRYIGTHPLVVTGIVFNALSFFSFLALLSVAPLSFAVPATAVSYVLKTALSRWYLGEHVSARRWLGAACVAIGVYLVST